jgi:8-oxo-dGTP diphosphatase
MEKVMFGNGEVILNVLDKNQFLEIDNPIVTSVHALFIKNKELLMTVNPRGVDIIGGHVEKNETIEQTLIRESYEEGYVVPLDYQIIGAIEVNNQFNPLAIEKGYPLIGYQVFFKVSKFKLEAFKANFECIDRTWIHFDEIKNKHHKWLNSHQEILNLCL